MIRSIFKIYDKIIICYVLIFYGVASIVISRSLIRFDEFKTLFFIAAKLTALALSQVSLYQPEVWIPNYCNI